MVSAGDTDISLYIRPGSISNISKGVYSGQVKTQNTLSAKICLIFNFFRGGGGHKLGTKSQNKVNLGF